MNANQIIRHLEDLKKEAEGHFTNDGDDEIFHQDTEALQAAIDAVKQLSEDVGIPAKLDAIKEEDLQFLAESAFADACAPGNPKDASVEDLKELFKKIIK